MNHFSHFVRDKGNWLSQSAYVTLNLFFKTEIPNHASAMAHYFLLSAVPLAYILNTIISGSPEPSEALYFLLNTLHLNFMDVDFSRSTDKFYGLFKVTNWVSILVLFWSSKGLMRSVQGAFTVIFAGSRKRRFFTVNMISFLIIPFSFLILGLSMLGDYLVVHMDYAGIDNPALAQTLKSIFTFINALAPFLLIWAIAFLAYYFIPPKKPALNSAIGIGFLCALSIALLQFLTNTIFKVDQYIRVYGPLGAIIFAMIWAYVISIVFLLYAEFLYVTGKIDVIALEKLFLETEERSKLAEQIEHFLFKRSERVFEKYGHSYRKGEVVIRQDDDTSTIYFLYSGKVGVYDENRGARIRLGEVKQGEIFGELAYLLGERRSATVLAESDCFLFTLTPQMFEGLMNFNPRISRLVIESLCKRIPRKGRQDDIQAGSN